MVVYFHQELAVSFISAMVQPAGGGPIGLSPNTFHRLNNEFKWMPHDVKQSGSDFSSQRISNQHLIELQIP